MEVISSIYNSGYNIKKFYLGSRELNLAYLGNQVIYDEVIGDNDLNYILYEFYGSDTLPNTVEAPVKRAILKGQTLINYATDMTLEYVTNGNYCSGILKNSEITSNKTITIVNNNSYAITGVVNNLNNAWVKNVNITANSYLTLTLSSSEKLWRIRTLNNSGVLLDDFVNSRFIIYDGNFKNTPYFEGMQSTKMPVLMTTGKNIVGNLEKGSIGANGEDDNNNPTLYTRTGFILLKKDTTYSFSLNGVKRSYHLYLYDLNKNFKEKIGMKNEYTPEVNCYIRLFQMDNINNALYQVEEGTIATPYEPYQSNILTVNEDVVLRGVGEVRDTLDLMTGEVVERIGEVIFDGSVDENWELWATYPEESAIFKLSKENSLKLMKEFDKNGVFKCDKFSTVLKSSLINAGVKNPHAISFFGSDKEYIQLRVYKSLLKSIDVTGLREYLTNEPIAVQYKLATESVKTVDLTMVDQDEQTISKLNSFNGTTHVSTEVAENNIYPTIAIEVATE